MQELQRGRCGTPDSGECRAARHTRLRMRALAAAFVALAAPMTAGCVYYEAVPVHQPGPSKFDRSWAAAQAAAEDVGVTITDVDRASGTIHGYRSTADVTVTVWQQADGSVRVAFNVRAPSGPDSALSDQLSSAYNRRMGR